MMQPNSKAEMSDFRTYLGNNRLETSHEYKDVEAHEVIMMAKKNFMSKEEGERLK